MEKKSIADLVAARSRKPSFEDIDKITTQIHAPVAPSPTPSADNFQAPKMVNDPMLKIKRISVNVPVELYLKAKTKATLQDETLMGYITGLMEKDLN